MLLSAKLCAVQYESIINVFNIPLAQLHDLQVAKQQKKEQLPGMLSVTAKTLPVPLHPPAEAAQRIPQPASPLTQTASCTTFVSEARMRATTAAAARCSEHLQDTAVSSQADITSQALHKVSDAFAAEQRHAQVVLQSEDQPSRIHEAAASVRQSRQKPVGAGTKQASGSWEQAKGKKGKPRPSSWQRKKAAKLRQAQQLLHTDAALATANESGIQCCLPVAEMS